MELLESIVQTGGESIDEIVSDALNDGDKGRLLAIKDLLEKMSELEMLQTVDEKLVDLARNAHGEESAEFATTVNNLAATLENQVCFCLFCSITAGGNGAIFRFSGQVRQSRTSLQKSH